MRQKVINGIALALVKNYKELSELAAQIILEKIQKTPYANLLTPTGTTPQGIYAILSKKPPKLFENITFFNFDEYAEDKNGKVELLSANDVRSYKYFMKYHLFEDLDVTKSYFPTQENISSPGNYDRLIKEKGGIDFCLDAIGEDGHTFGFNMPGSEYNSVTRLVQLNTDTQQVNTKLTGLPTPQWAISTGIATGMQSKEIVVIISGKRKAEILRRILYSPIDPQIPATILRHHSHCYWIVDRDAASRL